MRKLSDQTVGPALAGESDLLAGHELQSAVRAGVHDGVGAEDFFEVGVERREAVVRRSAARHQEAHGVALIPERRLHGDEDVAESHALNQKLSTERVDATGSSAPLALNLRGVRAE